MSHDDDVEQQRERLRKALPNVSSSAARRKAAER